MKCMQMLKNYALHLMILPVQLIKCKAYVIHRILNAQ